MENVKVAVATAGLSRSLRDAIIAASDFGAGGIQLDVRSEVTSSEFGDTACRQLLHMLEERDLKVASATFPLRRPLYDPIQIDGRVNAVKEGMRLAARLKCRVLTLRIGRCPDESATDDIVRLLGSLNDLARLGSHLGVTIAVTTSGDSAETLRKLVQSVTDGLVGIDLDPAGCIAAQLNPVDVLKVLHTHVIHVQARDAVRDLETGGREVPLGRGETSWEEIIAILADSRYQGWMTVRRTSGNDIPGDLERGVAYLRNVAGGF